MNHSSLPVIFSPERRLAVRRRFSASTKSPDSPSYVIDDMVEDVIERLGFLRFEPRRALVVGDWTHALGSWLEARGAEPMLADPYGAFEELAWDQELPFGHSGFDLVVSLGILDTVNDLPGALIHMRNALAPGGLAIASFVGAGSLPALREAMLAADGERPAPRLHPAVDVRAGGQLLQRAGWADPVVDSRVLSVRYSNLSRLITDLRSQGLSNCLVRPGPPLTRRQRQIANESFGTDRVETFEILTLTGWRR